MQALILAAGRGHRMGELTREIPKPLLRVGKKYLIEYAILKLVEAGIREIVINIYHHGEKIRAALGEGQRYGVTFVYSEEKERLEVGGGIINALHFLGDQPFLVMSSDIITDFPISTLPQQPKGLAHLVMVDNPIFHVDGDFGLKDGQADLKAKPFLTFANIGIYRKELFAALKPKYLPFSQLIFPAIKQKKIWGEHYKGPWFNIGTTQDLAAIRMRTVI